MPMRKVSGDDERSAARLALLMQALAGLFRAASIAIQPSVFQEMVCRVGVQLGRQAGALYRLTRQVGRFSSRTRARRLEWIGKQFGWDLRVAGESEDPIRITMLDCPFARPGESDPYMCELASGIFGGVVADELGYAKVCIAQCPLSSLQCNLTIYSRRSEESLAASGVVYPRMGDRPVQLAEQPPDSGPGARLTSREVQVLQGIVQGLPDKEIAEGLQLSVRTVENHAARIRKKLRISGNRAALIRFAIQNRLIDL